MFDIIVVTLIIIETCIVYNISSQSDKYPPRWRSTRRFVEIFNWINIFNVLSCCYVFSNRGDRVMPESNVKVDNKISPKKTVSFFSPRDKVDTVFKFAGGKALYKDNNDDSNSLTITNYVDTQISYELDTENGITWKDVAHSIDVFSQLLFSVAILFTSIVLFIYAATLPDTFLN